MSEISILNGYKIKDKKAVRYYDTISNMKSDTTLKAGMYVKTKGYYSVNDGGNAEYYITDTESLTLYQEELTGGLYAQLIITNDTNVKHFGAKGDGENDDSQYFNRALNFLNIIKVPKGVYLLSNTIELSTTENIKIIGGYGSIIKPNGCIAFSKNGGINEIEFINIEFDLSIELSNGISIINQVTTTGITNSLKVTDCKFISDVKRTNKKAIELIGGMNSVISNCEFDGVYGFYQKQAINTTVNNSRFTRCSYCIYADSNGTNDTYSCGIKISDCFILASICGFKIVANDYFTLINTMIDYTTYPVSLIGQGLGVIDNCYLTSTNGNTVINIKDDTLSQNEYYSGNNTGEISQFIKITNCDLITHCEIDNDTSNINQESICLYVENSYNISVINNSFRFYTHYGIFFKDVSVVNVDNCRFAHNNLYALTNDPYIIDGLRNNSVNNYDADRYVYSNLFNNQGDKFRRYVAQVTNIDIPNVFRDRNYGSVSIPAGSLTATVTTGLYTPIKSLILSCNNNVKAYYTGKGDISTFTIRLSEAQESATEVSWLAIC